MNSSRRKKQVAAFAAIALGLFISYRAGQMTAQLPPAPTHLHQGNPVAPPSHAVPVVAAAAAPSPLVCEDKPPVEKIVKVEVEKVVERVVTVPGGEGATGRAALAGTVVQLTSLLTGTLRDMEPQIGGPVRTVLLTTASTLEPCLGASLPGMLHVWPSPTPKVDGSPYSSGEEYMKGLVILTLDDAPEIPAYETVRGVLLGKHASGANASAEDAAVPVSGEYFPPYAAALPGITRTRVLSADAMCAAALKSEGASDLFNDPATGPRALSRLCASMLGQALARSFGPATIAWQQQQDGTAPSVSPLPPGKKPGKQPPAPPPPVGIIFTGSSCPSSDAWEEAGVPLRAAGLRTVQLFVQNAACWGAFNHEKHGNYGGANGATNLHANLHVHPGLLNSQHTMYIAPPGPVARLLTDAGVPYHRLASYPVFPTAWPMPALPSLAPGEQAPAPVASPEPSLLPEPTHAPRPAECALMWPRAVQNAFHHAEKALHQPLPSPFAFPQPFYQPRATYYAAGNVTAILTVYRRNNLAVQIEALLRQSVRPAEIIVLQNGNFTNVEATIAKYRQSTDGLVKHVWSMDKNLKFHGRFTLPLLLETEYAIIIDDDVLIGNRWIEYCRIKCQQWNAVIGANGRGWRLQGDYPGNTWQHLHAGDRNDVPEDVEVDFVGHSWFFKSEWAHYGWSERAYTFANGEDIAFSAALQLYGGIKSIVPRQKISEPDTFGEISYSFDGPEDGAATWKKGDHWQVRREIAGYWISRGWRLTCHSAPRGCYI